MGIAARRERAALLSNQILLLMIKPLNLPALIVLHLVRTKRNSTVSVFMNANRGACPCNYIKLSVDDREMLFYDTDEHYQKDMCVKMELRCDMIHSSDKSKRSY